MHATQVGGPQHKHFSSGPRSRTGREPLVQIQRSSNVCILQREKEKKHDMVNKSDWKTKVLWARLFFFLLTPISFTVQNF